MVDLILATCASDRVAICNLQADCENDSDEDRDECIEESKEIEEKRSEAPAACDALFAAESEFFNCALDKAECVDEELEFDEEDCSEAFEAYTEEFESVAEDCAEFLGN